MASDSEPGQLSAPQLAKIWAAAREIGLDADDVHELVDELTGKSSVKTLTTVEASRVIDILVERGATPGAFDRLPAGVPRLVTPWQVARIGELIRLLGWRDARPMCEGVIRRAIGRTAPRTSGEAGRVIEAFKSILRRRFGDPAPREEQQQ